MPWLASYFYIFFLTTILTCDIIREKKARALRVRSDNREL